MTLALTLLGNFAESCYLICANLSSCDFKEVLVHQHYTHNEEEVTIKIFFKEQ